MLGFPGCSRISPRIGRNMKSHLQPWHLLLPILAGWINRKQQDAVDYLLTENRILRDKLGKNRVTV